MTNQIPGAVPDPSAVERRLRSLTTPFWIPVSGGSMRPTLREGDAVYITPTKGDLSGLRPGDIVLLFYQGVPIVHRYLGKIDGKHYESADFSCQRRAVAEHDIVGKAHLRRRQGRVSSLKPSSFWRIRCWFRQRSGGNR